MVVVFILEMSLSKPIGLRQSERLLLPPRRLGRARSVEPSNRPIRMQGSKHLLLAPSGATPKVLKLIKEDHFACNHEDVLSSSGPTGFVREQEQAEPGSRPDRSVHPIVRTHILAAIRLFTCQRANNIELKQPDKRPRQFSLPSS